MKKKEPEPRLDEMTLRDLMAMFAMQGLVAHGGWQAEYHIPEAGIAGVTVAEEAYKYAAAMIEERSKQ